MRVCSNEIQEAHEYKERPYIYPEVVKLLTETEWNKTGQVSLLEKGCFFCNVDNFNKFARC